MKYSYEFKLMCVEMYREGRWPETPSGIKTENFHGTIRVWARMVESNGSEVLRHNSSNTVWTPEMRYELVAQVIAGKSFKSVAIEAGIERSILYQWVRKYKEFGYNGLVDIKRGRKSKEPNMKKKLSEPKPLTESEREELIRLRAENEYMKAENEVIKKQITLRHERWAAQLKAKKQRSSKNSEKKDFD